MDNEKVLTAVAVIAVVAVVGRIIINRQQSGKINWLKLGGILALGAVFSVVMLTVDSYRLATWASGPVDTAEDMRSGHVIGREAGKAVSVAESVNEGLPIYFALEADSARETGYWQLKEGTASDATTREVLVSRADSTKTAIKRTTSKFSITRHPADEGDYVKIYRLSLRNGEKVLAVMTDYDARRAGKTPVMTSKPLSGKMAEMAEKEHGVSQLVYVSSYDSAYYAASTARRLLMSAFVALAATAAAGGVAFAIYRKTRR